MTFLSSGSLVFSVSWELFLNKKNSGPKKYASYERTAHLASYTFFQEMLINIKLRQSHSSINHQEHLFHKMLITSDFHPANIAKFLKTSFLKSSSRSSLLQMLFKKGVLKACSIIKYSTTGVFCEVFEIFKNTFSYRTPLVVASVFFLKKSY